MNTTKISESEISDLKISSLPTKPTAPASLGGKGYTSAQMKAAFDRLPLYIIERFNSLIDDIHGEGNDSLSGAMPTGIYDGHTLSDLFRDLTDGSASAYIHVAGKALGEALLALEESNAEMKNTLEQHAEFINSGVLDAGSPSERNGEAGR